MVSLELINIFLLNFETYLHTEGKFRDQEIVKQGNSLKSNETKGLRKPTDPSVSKTGIKYLQV